MTCQIALRSLNVASAPVGHSVIAKGLSPSFSASLGPDFHPMGSSSPGPVSEVELMLAVCFLMFFRSLSCSVCLRGC